jgi:hypothetical protein
LDRAPADLTGPATNAMKDWPVYDVAADVRLCIVAEMPAVSPALEAEIDRLWAAAQQRMRGRLFNGLVFSADHIEPHLIAGHWTEYRRVVAQIDRPELYDALHTRPLAVDGVIVGPGGVVIGRRPAGAIYQAGEWQLAPAGSVDPGAARDGGAVDYVWQLLTEMREELGVPAGAVRDPRVLAIVEHAEDGWGSHVADLGIAVDTDLDAPAILSAHAAEGDGEYDPLLVVPLDTLAAFVAEHKTSLNRQAPVFLERRGLIG